MWSQPSDQLCGTWQTRQVGKIVDPLDPWRNGATLAVELDAAQPHGAGGKCIGLELVTDVDHRMQWHTEMTTGQPESSYFGFAHANLVRGQQDVDVTPEARSGSLHFLLLAGHSASGTQWPQSLYLRPHERRSTQPARADARRRLVYGR